MMVVMCGCVSAQSVADESLRDKRVSLHMKAKTFRVITARLMFKYDVPIGFEQSILDNDPVIRYYQLEPQLPLDPKYMGDIEIPSFTTEVSAEYLLTVDFENARLEDVMDSIVSQMKNYQWTINDGVVNIFPIKGRDPRLEKLLGSNVDEFLYGKGQPIGSIEPKITFYLPMFQKFLDEYDLGTNNDIPYLECYGPNNNIECAGDRKLTAPIILKDVTFRELLNKITKIKRGGWLLRLTRSRPDDPQREYLELKV